MHRGEIRGSRGHDLPCGLPAAREGDAIDVGGPGQRRSGHRATAIDHVECARWQTRFFYQRYHAQYR